MTGSNCVGQSEPKYDFNLQDPYADWMVIAGETFDDVKPTRLVATLGRNTSEMTPEDVMLAYAFAAYLCEGYGAETIETSCAARMTPTIVFAASCAPASPLSFGRDEF